MPGEALSELGLLHTYERYQASGEQFVSISKQVHVTQMVRLAQVVA